MKLIDADELRWTSLQDGFGRINTCIVFESDINAMPTVDAIPIEFIEKYAQLSDDAVALFGVPVGVLKNVYRSLIDEWRKENEERI